MIVITTESGAVYNFDNEELTWQRQHHNIDLLGMARTTTSDDGIFGVTAGFLARPIDEPVIGERFFFDMHDGHWVCTTAVKTVEEV